MAKPDHTAVARPSNPSDGKVIRKSGGPPRSADIDEETQQCRQKAADIRVAVYALTRMLPDKYAYQLVLLNEAIHRRSRKPLPEVYTEGLKAAICYLIEYARMLDLEPRMKR